MALVAPDGGRPHGVAHLHDTPAGRMIQLEVGDLPPAPAWHRYVCWFVGPADSLTRPNRVAAGSFFTDSRGHAQLSWTRPVDPQRFPLVGVTLEPADGTSQRRGPKVLVTKPPS